MVQPPRGPEEQQPVAFHEYLTDASGGRLPVYRLCNEYCPECGRTRKGVLGVTFETRDGRAETVQCLKCDYTLTRPKRDPPGRRMNQGNSGGG